MVKNWYFRPIAHEIVRSIDSHVSGPGSDLPPVEPWDTCSPGCRLKRDSECEAPRGTQLSRSQTADLKKLRVNAFFEAAKSWVICHVAVDD